jgi:protein-L-isoaspartate(D-aspartate) O-methyltransferase
MAIARRLRSLVFAVTAVLAGMTALTAMAAPAVEDVSLQARRRMIEEQIRRRGVTDPAVLSAIEKVPRHLFVPEDERDGSYADQPLPIGNGQTISQPYVVALMTSLLKLEPGSRVLEIGTGSGYQAAVLAQLAAEVYSIEIVAPLAERARATLAGLGYENVHVRVGDGFQGWPAKAPFDAIIVTAAPPRVPEPLLRQLKAGGKLVVPVGELYQDLVVYTKRKDGGFDRKEILPVRFVPMTGEAQHVPP